MQEQVAIQSLLTKKLAELQSKNPSFSVRAFAGRLGLQPSATNEILRGERRVSRKMAERIANRLHLDPSERVELLRGFEEAKSKKRDEIGGDYLKLTADQFRILSDWLHFAILNLISTQDFKHDSAWIAKRLAVSESQTKTALDRLLRLG